MSASWRGSEDGASAQSEGRGKGVMFGGGQCCIHVCRLYGGLRTPADSDVCKRFYTFPSFPLRVSPGLQVTWL